MNERIKELWIEGTQTSIPREGDYSSVSAKNIEKFAELIVEECTRKIEDIAESSNNPQLIYRVAVELLEHFGVE